MGERRRRYGDCRPVLTKPKSTFTDMSEGPVQRLEADGVWRAAPDAPKLQLEIVGDNHAAYLVRDGVRVAYRANKEWVPMTDKMVFHEGPLQ